MYANAVSNGIVSNEISLLKFGHFVFRIAILGTVLTVPLVFPSSFF